MRPKHYIKLYQLRSNILRERLKDVGLMDERDYSRGALQAGTRMLNKLLLKKDVIRAKKLLDICVFMRPKDVIDINVMFGWRSEIDRLWEWLRENEYIPYPVDHTRLNRFAISFLRANLDRDVASTMIQSGVIEYHHQLAAVEAELERMEERIKL